MRLTRGVVVWLAAAAACAVVAMVWALPRHEAGPMAGDAKARPRPAASKAASPAGRPKPKVPAGPQPKVAVDEHEHSFGVLDPSEEVAHTFVLRNVGGAPLTLQRGETTCKCLLSELPDGKVPPGGSAEVRLSSKLQQEQGDFSHAAMILTNDPSNPRVELRIQGTVRRYLGIDPNEFMLRNTCRDQTQVVMATVYSQVWEQFALKDLRSTLQGTAFKVQPSAPATLEEFNARSAWDVEVTLPPVDTEGFYQANLHFLAVPEEKGQKERPLDVRVLCKVPKRIALTGPKYTDMTKTLDFGNLWRGRGSKARIVMSVSDEHRALSISNIKHTPDFLQVRVNPMGKNAQGEESGQYLIEVEVPKDAPPCALVGERHGSVEFSTGHPIVKTIQFDVTLAVISSSHD